MTAIKQDSRTAGQEMLCLGFNLISSKIYKTLNGVLS